MQVDVVDVATLPAQQARILETQNRLTDTVLAHNSLTPGDAFTLRLVRGVGESRSRLASFGDTHCIHREARHFRSRLLHCRADMLLDQAAGETDISRQRGVAQLQMLIPPPRTGVDHGQPVIAPRLVEQLAAEMHGPWRGARR